MSLIKKLQEELRIEKENSPLFKFQKFIRSKKFKAYKREVLGITNIEEEAEKLLNEEFYYYKLLKNNQKKFKDKFLEEKMTHDQDITDYISNAPSTIQDQRTNEGNVFKGAKVVDFDCFIFRKVVNRNIVKKDFSDFFKNKKKSDFGKNTGNGNFDVNNEKNREIEILLKKDSSRKKFKREDLVQNLILRNKREEEEAKGESLSEYNNKNFEKNKEDFGFSEFVFDYMKGLELQEKERRIKGEEE